MSLNRKPRDWLPILLFCITAGLLATLWGYNYSAGNAEEQLPFIYRALDPAYLARDFFTNTFAQFGPRTIFSEFIALFARFFSLSAVLFSFTLISNIAIAFISSLTAKYFFSRSIFSIYLTAAAVLTIKTFWLGYSNIIYRTFLEPAHLAMPFLLLGFYLILQKKYVIAAVSFGIAALFHPLLGLETGWLLLGASFLVYLIQVFRKEIRLRNGIFLIIGGFVLVGFTVALILPYSSQESIPSDVFINLIAYVRHPHHYVPSTFETWQYGQAAVYLTAFCFVFWFALKRSDTLRSHERLLQLIGGLILLLTIGGYLFVEVWPSRMWTAAQMFRLPYLIKWFSIVLIAGWIGSIIDHPVEKESHIFGLTAGIALVTPVSLALVALLLWVRKIIHPRSKFLDWLLHDFVIFALVIISVVVYKPEFRTWALFFLFFNLILTMYLYHWKISGMLISTAVTLTVAVLFVLFSSRVTPPELLKREIPVFSFYKITGETEDMANFAKANTPKDALFLTPPNYGEFRYLADRAIVIDFVAYPFQDKAMLNWHNRMIDIYGEPTLLGFDSFKELNQHYLSLNDERIKELASKYGFEYAVLFLDTPTSFPILYTTSYLRLVQITQ
ncbi:MAG: hypothetical protein FD147_823 [Chloroflexi bacterium]|nr:MAG: hypothetical protein FD147_823 [Chloroflexota bacterium]MBA4376601.1 hypothetical protein [Anaerolinea sp.]